MENDQTAPNAAAASAPQTAQTAPQTGIPNLTDGLGAVLSNPELMAKLPQMMAMLRPMQEQQPAADSTTEAPPAAAQTAPAGPAVPAIATPQKKATDRRTALLVALKPFLSDDRKNAVDAMLRISALGDVLRRL